MFICERFSLNSVLANSVKAGNKYFYQLQHTIYYSPFDELFWEILVIAALDLLEHLRFPHLNPYKTLSIQTVFKIIEKSLIRSKNFRVHDMGGNGKNPSGRFGCLLIIYAHLCEDGLSRRTSVTVVTIVNPDETRDSSRKKNLTIAIIT